MAWTYNSTAPNSSDRSWIRLRIGDNSSDNQLLQDEWIDALLESEGSKHEAAAVCADSLGAKFAQKADKAIGKLRISQGKVADSFFKLADRLRTTAALSESGAYAGGISESDRETDLDDTDAVRPAFARNQFANPGSVTEDSTAGWY